MSENSCFSDYLFYDEIIDGQKNQQPICPSVIHNEVRTSIFMIFNEYIHKLAFNGMEVIHNITVRFSDKDYFTPDVAIISDCEQYEDDIITCMPDLVVEVISPNTAELDRMYKKSVYEKAGVKEYWLVSPEAETVEQYLLKNGKFVLQGVYTVYPEYLLEKTSGTKQRTAHSEFKCHLFNDLTITLNDIFQDMEEIREIINRNLYK